MVKIAVSSAETAVDAFRAARARRLEANKEAGQFNQIASDTVTVGD